MPVPRPDNDQQVTVLSTIWDLFMQGGEFPTFKQIDRAADQRHDLDAFPILQSMPDGLIYGGRTPSDQDKIGLTVAGAAALAGAGTTELLNLFVTVVRYAADVQKSWAGPPVEATDDAVIDSATLPQFVSMPASGRIQMLSCLRALLRTEQWGWNSASGDGAEWSFGVDRRVRPFRGVVDVQDYLVRQYGAEADELHSEEPALTQPVGLSPSQRQTIISRLSRMPGADSHAIFTAYGLGAAYESAGRYSNRKARVNAALAEAEKQNIVDDILLYAQGQDTSDLGRGLPESTNLKVAPAGRGSELPDEKLFISHAYADRELATALKNALVLGGIPSARIFFSSQRSSGIPAGKDVRQHLREQLAGSGLVVELLTLDFLRRPMCLVELGAAWALEKDTYPIVVPPLTVSEAKEAIGDVLMGQLGTDDEIDDALGDLSDRITDHLAITLRRQELGEAQRFFKSAFRALPTH